jgi:energy-coupling factor transporter ATP-binding protein EcfA2
MQTEFLGRNSRSEWGVEMAPSVDSELGVLAGTDFFGVPRSGATTKPNPGGNENGSEENKSPSLPSVDRQSIASDIPTDEDKHAQHVKEVATQLNLGESETEQYCEFCKKFQTEQCAMKDDPAPPNKDSLACYYYEEKPESAGFQAESEESEKGEPERKSQADKLVGLCLVEEPTLFKDQTGTPFAWVNQKGVKVTVPLRSRLFKSWLSSLLWEAEQKAPGNEALSSALNVLVSKAMFDGPRITLYNRVALGDNCFWIDMTDDKHRAIKVTAEGWTIIDNPPILFKRHSHQLPLAIPTRDKKEISAWRLLDFFNIPATEEERKKNDCKDMLPNSRLVIVCQCVSFLIPNIPHPILLFYGTQGSGKSLIFKLLKRLLDPSSIELLTLPRSENERIQQLEHHWICGFDNVTHLPDWMSDTLCRAVTGSGFSKRELYTDDEEDVLYNFIRCVLLNGINVAAQKGDLLDRSTIQGLVNIETKDRRTEEAIFAEFEKCKSEILGAFLDVLVEAMQLIPKVNPTKLFRMADFTRWGIAISQALGNTEKEFLDAYELKVKAQSEEAAHASPVATVLLDSFNTATEPWEGTPTQLYMRLNEHAKMLGITTRQKAWPKAPSTLVRRLNELAPSLKSLGLDVETGIRIGHGGPRRVRINTVTADTADTNHEKDGEKGDGKGDSTKSEPSPKPTPLEHGQSTFGDDGDDGDSTLHNNSREDA